MCASPSSPTPPRAHRWLGALWIRLGTTKPASGAWSTIQCQCQLHTQINRIMIELYIIEWDSFFSDPQPFFSDPHPFFLTHNPSFLTHNPSFLTHNPSFLTHNPSFLTHNPSFLTPNPSFLTHNPSFLTHNPSFLTHNPFFPTHNPSPFFLTQNRDPPAFFLTPSRIALFYSDPSSFNWIRKPSVLIHISREVRAEIITLDNTVKNNIAQHLLQAQ